MMNSSNVNQRIFNTITTSVFALSVLTSGCQQPEAPVENQSSTATEPVSFFVSCDTNGWIVPCGCSAGQSGGLLKRASLIKQYDGEIGMGLEVHNIGAVEAALGLEKRNPDDNKHFISANVTSSDGTPFTSPHSKLVAGDQTFLIVGVMDPKFANENVLVSDPYQAILDALENNDCDGVIVLAYMEREALMDLAGQLPEVDVVIGGPTGQTIAPVRKGATLVMAATNKGKFIAQVTYRPDQSARWSGSIIEVEDSFENDPEQVVNLASFHRRLGEADFDSETTGLKRRSQFQFVSDLKYAGNQTCVACHAKDCQQYLASKHAVAWKTLVDKDSHVDPYCQQCHTTGYGAPSGFRTIAQSEALVNVGCESCHGPSAAHVKAPKTRTPFAAKDQCIQCHDPENSPEFHYEKYWQKIVHGLANDENLAEPKQ